MKDDPDYKDVPGKLRTGVVWIGGAGNIAYSSLNPPPPDDVPACLAQTVDYLRNEGMQQMTQGIITRMAIGHTHFEAVHPFRDGNGRVGRLLLPLMMAAEGHVPLYLSPYLEANKGNYYTSLKQAQQRLEWAPTISFMADAVTGTVAELMRTRNALSELSDRWKVRRKFRKSSAAARALDELPHYPVVTAKRLGELLDVSPPQAHQAIAQLTEAGILKERTGMRATAVMLQNRRWPSLTVPSARSQFCRIQPTTPNDRLDPSAVSLVQRRAASSAAMKRTGPTRTRRTQKRLPVKSDHGARL